MILLLALACGAPSEENAGADSPTLDSAAAPGCPSSEAPVAVGAVDDEALTETSGLAEGRANPGVLWVHEDSGAGPELRALSADGGTLGIWSLEAGAQDWEDIAAVSEPETGAALIYVGDIGDNGEERDAVVVYRVAEPEVGAGGALTAEAITLAYPEGPRDSEALLADPETGDLFLVTKDRDGQSGVYRKAAPHAPDTTEPAEPAELSLVASLDFSSEPLAGVMTTGGDISPDGRWIVIRTYLQDAYLWYRAPGQTVGEALAGEPCVVELPAEPQGESVGFSLDGQGLYTLSEGELQTVYYTALSWE